MSETKEAVEIIETTIVEERAVAIREEGAIIQINPVADRIFELARDPSLDEAKLQALVGMQNAMADREARRLFNQDMALAQSECQAVVRAAVVKLSKPGEADKGGYKYAALEDIDEMLRPIMTKYGFSVTYDRVPRQGDGGGFVITGTLRHRGGHEITGSFALPLDSGPGRNNLQAAGSTDSYGRKYVLMGFFNIVRKNADDDGFAAGAVPVSRDQAARLVQLVDEAKIATGADEKERKATVKRWFQLNLSYEINAYTEVRQEDYARIARLLKSLADQAKETEAEGMKV